jgi:preprotein translocase subunit SecB
MATTNGGQGGVHAAPAAQAPDQQPQLNVVAQYIKDFSFENPNAPRSFAPQQQPAINIQINVNAKPLAENDVEIELKLEGKAEAAGTVLFSFDLSYAGIFRLQNVPQENMGPLMLIECPRLLFPFAREIIATASRNAGFPPLLIDPVDFVGLYRQKAAQMAQAPAAQG